MGAFTPPGHHHHHHYRPAASRRSPTLVAVLCAASFFAGVLLDELPGLPSTGRGFTVHRAARRDARLLEAAPQQLGQAQLEGGGAGADAAADAAAAVARPQSPFPSFEALVEASGMLATKPPASPVPNGLPAYVVQPVQLLSWWPRAFLWPSFMDAERCAHVVAQAQRRLRPSALALKKGDTVEGTAGIRTSQGTFLARHDDPDGVLAWVEDKIAVLTGIPAGHGEPFNVLRYDVGQHYDSHFDSFAEEDYGKQANQRAATVLIYLSDVEEGGETIFLQEGKRGTDTPVSDYKACDHGLKVRPRMGDALVFWSTGPDGAIDRHALHGGCPVVRGEKWVMTKWIRAGCLTGSPCL